MKKIEAQLRAIEAVLVDAGVPLGRQEILERLDLELDDRTLQRRLKRLLEDGRIDRSGKSAAVVYSASMPTRPHVEPPEETGVVPELAIDFSAEAQQVLAHVLQPIQKRAPVSHDANLLNVAHHLSKSERKHLMGLGQVSTEQAPAGTYARAIMDRLLIDLSWASSHLEGNTYTRLDTQNLIEFGHEAQGRDATESQMILNHKRAIEMLIESAGEIGFNRHTIFNLHAALSDNLLTNRQDEGRLRRQPFGIEEQFDRLLAMCGKIEDPFEQALYVMTHIPYLQPFMDCNKRVSRLAANIPFIQNNLCPLSFVDVPKDDYISATLCVYELADVRPLKEVFIWAYERSTQLYAAVKDSMAEPDMFRLRYREELHNVVRSMVAAGHSPQMTAIRGFATGRVSENDQQGFDLMVQEELMNLHEGNFARYGIRPAEFKDWWVATRRL